MPPSEQEQPVEEARGLTKALAELTGEDPETIEAEAAEIEIGSPWNAEIEEQE